MAEILVINDDPVTRRVLQRGLQRQGYSVTIAYTGPEGIKQAEYLQPAMIICDWMLPGGMDGLEICRLVKANPDLTTTYFLLVTAKGRTEERVQGLDAGADDLLSKPLDMSELKARVRAGLRLHQLARDLQGQKRLLEAELAEAAAYVRSLLPPQMNGKVPIHARFIPCRQLGGDCFDYYWLDPDYLVIYLLDVSGHGLGSALLSTSVLNVLRSQSLPGVNFYRPEGVLRGLNETFQMNDQHDKYFTIWYGVYNRARRQLTYSSAGHPPAVLISPPKDGSAKVERLRTPGMPIGMMPETIFTWQRSEVPPGSSLYVFSDGIYEIQKVNKDMLGLDTFVEFLTSKPVNLSVDEILEQIRALKKEESFSDDLSLLKVNFG